MEKNSCPFCGSENVESKKENRSGKMPDGTSFQYQSDLLSCVDCGTVIDHDGKGEQAYLAAYEVAKKESLEKICRGLADQGLSMAYVERAFHLPQRTIARWKSQGCSASGFALMSLVGLLPWLAKVADQNYDRAFASKEVVTQAGGLLLAVVGAKECTASVEVFTSEKTMGIVAAIHQKDSGYQVIRGDTQPVNVITSTEDELLRA